MSKCANSGTDADGSDIHVPGVLSDWPNLLLTQNEEALGPVHLAATSGNVVVLTKLIKRGADLTVLRDLPLEDVKATFFGLVEHVVNLHSENYYNTHREFIHYFEEDHFEKYVEGVSQMVKMWPALMMGW